MTIADKAAMPVWKVESATVKALDPGCYFEWHPMTGGFVYAVRPNPDGKGARGWKIGQAQNKEIAAQIIGAYAVGFSQAKNGPEAEPVA